ncbi:MAG TPA: outer membrane protein transport protein [Thermoanaerobaculia bacterium]
MRRRGSFVARVLGVAVLGAVVTAPLYAAGFGIFEQGAKAMGMAGAFTAQADDPSALFHNVGGVAFATDRQFSVGATWIYGAEAEFEGANPFPGEGYTAEQENLSETPPHLYYIQPIGSTLKFGFGVMTPFGLTTEWENPDQFAGRFLSTKAGLRSFDLQPTIAWQATPNFGIGFGAIARVSDLELNRNIPAVNPFTQRVVDVGRLVLEGDFSEGYGFTAGLLHRVGSSFSWGLSYRSKIKVEYDGEARATQISTGNPQLDAVIRTRVPFGVGLPVETEIEFPDQASLGLAFAITPNVLVETDFNYTGWSSFDEVPIDFVGGPTNSLPDQTLPEEWEDANNYRLGIRWTTSPTWQWRFGYVFDETPQPEAGVSPLLPDADRNGFTIGFGYTGGLGIDVALMYLPFDERERDESFPSEGPFFGTYNTTAYLFGATVNF